MHFKISVGQVALEYEGDETFFKNDVEGFVQNLLEKVSALGVVNIDAKVGDFATKGKRDSGSIEHSHSTNTVAKLLGAQTGPDLIMAAVAKKILVDGEATVSRQTIVAEMKKATSYYKRTYMNNLSAYLDTLTKADSLRLISEGVYGLPAKMRDSLEPRLSE